MKTRNYAIALLALTIAIAAVGISSNTVSADPCIAQLNYPIMPVVYSNSNVPIVVPLSATCTTYYGSQLYATGNAYDATSNAGLGSVSTVLQSVNGGTIFNGQLGFNLPPATQGHTVQVSVSIYDNQYGNLITATSETIQVGTGNPQITTVTQQLPYPYQSSVPIQAPYQTPYPTQSLPQLSQLARFRSQLQSRQGFGANNSTLFGYIAIFAILAAVIIGTVGIAVYARKQPNWSRPPPPPAPVG